MSPQSDELDQDSQPLGRHNGCSTNLPSLPPEVTVPRRPLTAALRDDRGLARLAAVLGITGVLAVAGTGA